MANSRNGHRGGVPFTAGSPRFAPGKTASASDLVPRAKPAIDLESFLAKASNANSTFRNPTVPGISPGAATLPDVSSTRARKAERCAGEGARLTREGRPAEAIPLLQRSIELNPGAAMSHHDLGVALTAAGRLEEAVEAFTAALRRGSSLATTHHFRAVILDNLGQLANAMEGYKAAVALNPDLVAAQIRLGEIYLGRRLRAESAAAFHAAAAAARGTAWARIAEARALEASGAVDDALVAIRAGAEAHPQSAEAHSLLGKLLGEAGLFAEAAAHYERAVELSPDMSLGWFGLATNRKFTAHDGPLVARMNAALARPNVTPSNRLLLHFALGKAHDDMGNYKEAMQNFEAGNRYRALGGRLGRGALTHYVDRMIGATPPGYRDRQPDPGVEDATPILIVGMPRSGSTLIEQILSSHPEIAAGGEQEFWSMRCAGHADIWGLTPTPEATRRLADDYLAALRPFGRDAKRVTDKALGNFMLLGVIHRAFPNATIIHCRRDPIDTALSIFTTHFEANLNYGAISSSTPGSTGGSWPTGARSCPRTASSRWTMRLWSAIPSRRQDGSFQPAASNGTTRVWLRIKTAAGSRPRVSGRLVSPSTARPSSVGGAMSHGSASCANWRRRLTRVAASP
jgi:tetratricopeptide (TPR) repeat protein